ncbi:MAG TPA: hypothetical protein VH394_29695 [Thermoanaerobaculia bacterium]|jgi:hypothetical protein|nr:hypothetical protein [Thermoanaerobaculia bacterium]
MDQARARFASLRGRLSIEELALLGHIIACPWCSGDFLVDLTVCMGTELLLRREMPPPTDEGLQALAEFESRSWAEWVNEAEAGNVDRNHVLRLAILASREVQLFDPRRAFELTLAVVEQRVWLSTTEGQDLLLDAMAVMMNAVRRSKIAEWNYGGLVKEAVVEGASLGAQARYRRAKGLMYWQKGDLEAAEQHLVRAAGDFSREGETGEEGTTMTLLGLFLQEEGKDATEACFMLMAGLTWMLRGQRPWLEARGLLALATVWARSGGQESLARSYLQYAESHYGNVIGLDPHLLWAHGKALAAVKDMSRAAAQLTEARAPMVAGRHFREAVLMTLDLTYAKVQGGAADWAAADVEKLCEWFAEEPSATIASSLVRWWEENVSTPLEERWAALERTLLMKLRDGGLGFEPLPFV